MMLNKTKARISVTPLKRKRVAPRATRSELLSLGLSFLLLVWAWAGTQGVAADWPTHRGNAARTGNVDGQPGPTVPKVLWAHVSTDHYLASPVLAGDNVIVSALGAFNSPVMHALAVAPSAKTRITWTASSPYLKLPTVCAPAYADGLLVFGDGMHQTDGAIVHAIRGDKGLPIWQYPIPGTLVHLEGAPTVANGKVYIGGGNAGVICLDGSKLQLEGKPIDLAAAQRLLDEKWKKLSEKYEQEKKVDPDFAIPPSIDALPKPTPTKVWQAGLNQWHVDAPLAVVGNRVLVCSAFLEAEKVGKRALLALDASNGNVAWSVDVAHNPWAGATVSGDMAIVGSSNIRLETKDVPRGRGEVVAVGTNDGKTLWRREIPGGVVAAIAAAGDRVIFTATDGKVRAFDLKAGRDLWTYDAQSPLFAAPAVAGALTYAADLRGVVHAIQTGDGKPVWKLDLSKEPTVKSAGQIFGSPIVAGGKLFVVTCNIDSPGERRPTAVVCIGNN